MNTKSLLGLNGSAQRRATTGARLTIRLPDDLLKVLEAWGRVEGRSVTEQGRYLLQHAVEARRDRLALTRR